MRNIHRIWIVLALIASDIHSGNAQNIIPNGDFEVNCGTPAFPLPGCESFSATCVQGWQRSHGTPYMDLGGGSVGPSAIIMGARKYPNKEESEGIYCNLNAPLEIRTRYTICFRYRTWGTSGSFVVRLGDGISSTLPTDCGEVAPNPSPSQQIYSVGTPANAPNGPWTTVTQSFIASGAFSQLYVYPIGTNADAFWLEVDGFELLDCESALYVMPTNIPSPAGLYARNSFIQAYSPGGMGTVIVNPNVPTTFRAGQFVQIDHNFVATPSSTAYFLAEIGTCGCVWSVASKTNHADGPSLPDGPRLPDAAGSADLWLYPNPTSGDFTIVSEEPLRYLTVTDLYGKAVLHLPYHKDVVEVRLSLAGLPAGTYLVQGQSLSGQTYLRKLVKQ